MPENYNRKPESRDLSYLRTAESRRRAIPQLKGLYERMRRPDIISLAGGTPNSAIFPFDDVGATSLAPPFPSGIAAPKLDDSAPTLQSHICEQNPDGYLADIELSTALQYSSAAGDDRLRDFMKEHVSKVHNIGFSDWDLVMSVGNTFAWDAVLRTFCEPTDVVLFEEFTFPSALDTCRARGCDTAAVKMDEYGLLPADLELKAKKFRPKLLYIIPTGQNPTGSVLTPERRRQVIEIANRYDFIVLEDEPYYYLQYDSGKLEDKSNTKSDGDLLKSLVASHLHFDTEGRVIRLDSFSKIMAPGVRLGWITAQQRFTDALRVTAESSSSKPSGFAEALVYGLLRRWGQSGFVTWLDGLREEYTRRRQLCLGTLVRELNGNSHVKLSIPQAGMFFWLEIKAKGKDTYSQELNLFEFAADTYKVLVVPGHWCQTDRSEELDTIFFRGTFTSASFDDIEEGATCLARAINEFTGFRRKEGFVMVSHPKTYEHINDCNLQQ